MNIWKKLEDILPFTEFLIFVCIGYVAMDIPITIVFGHRISNFEIIIDSFISIVLLFEHVKYHSKHHLVPHELSARLVDLIASLPLMTSFYLLDIISPENLAYVQTLHLLRIPRLVNTLVTRCTDKLLPKRFKFLAAGYITILVLNTFACGWLAIYPPVADSQTEYIKALYWLVTTIATVGYGDITPSTNGGRVYAMFMMIMGATIWGILIASASRMMLASDRRKEKRKEKMEALHSFFNHYEIPKQLQKQVEGFYNHLLTQKLSEDERAVMSELPSALQGELQVYMNLKPISQVSLFKNVSFECLSSVSKKLEQVFYAPGEQIIQKGEPGHEMYLIGHGTVTIHIGDHFITNLGSGHCFGEFALIENNPRTTDVTASTYCDIFKLSREKFDELFKAHAELRTNIEKIVADRKLATQKKVSDHEKLKKVI